VSLTVELIIRSPESAEKRSVGTIYGLFNPHVDTSPTNRETVARTVIGWAAEFADLDVTVRRKATDIRDESV
jgi:hypothetical protein